MPKVNYDKQPFRLCRWNKKFHTTDKSVTPTFRGDTSRPCEYYCDDGEESVDEDYCMKCFCNNWYETCERCQKAILKTEIKKVFEKEVIAMTHVCPDCYKDEEIVESYQEDEQWYIIKIKRWKELNNVN